MHVDRCALCGGAALETVIEFRYPIRYVEQRQRLHHPLTIKVSLHASNADIFSWERGSNPITCMAKTMVTGQATAF